jgi:phosphatidate cytidylyltransferase
MRSFGLRALTAVVLLPMVFALIWAPKLHLAFSLFITFIACVGLYEYYAMARRRQMIPETVGGIIAGGLVALSGHNGHLMSTTLTLYAAFVLVAILHMMRGQYSLSGLAASAFGIVYVGWFCAHITLLRSLPGIGPGVVTLLLVSIAVTDAGAYLTGSIIGRHKLAPKISPGKTWEGAVGGIGFTLMAMMICYGLSVEFRALPQWSPAGYCFRGVLLSCIGQIGDLAESCMKRSAGIKDSGSIFPGHGGVLDRCDGFLFAAPVMYYLVAPLFHG